MKNFFSPVITDSEFNLEKVPELAIAFLFFLPFVFSLALAGITKIIISGTPLFELCKATLLESLDFVELRYNQSFRIQEPAGDLYILCLMMAPAIVVYYTVLFVGTFFKFAKRQLPKRQMGIKQFNSVAAAWAFSIMISYVTFFFVGDDKSFDFFLGGRLLIGIPLVLVAVCCSLAISLAVSQTIIFAYKAYYTRK